MHSANVPETMRRSSRVPITLPIAVTSLEPSAPFSEICETLVVSAHGCAIFSPTRLEAGIPVQFRRKGGGSGQGPRGRLQAHGRGPARAGRWRRSWTEPENFWGLESLSRRLGASGGHSFRRSAADAENCRREATSQPGARRSRSFPTRTSSQFTERDLRAIVAEFVQPLHAEIVASEGKDGPGRRRSAAALIYRCRTFRPRWKRNCGSVCAKTWGRKC